MTFQYWYMLPISILVATTAMASGVGGATFFSPIFILFLGLPPDVAIGTALITEVFGFASGIYAYATKKLIDYKLGFTLLMATIPMALIGSVAAAYIPSQVLKIILGVGLFAVALSFLRSPEIEDVIRMDNAIGEKSSGDRDETVINTAEGEVIRYKVCNRYEGITIAGVGGLFVGMISTGLGELDSYFLLQRCRVPSKVSVATSVFVVAFTALSASAGHFIRFLSVGGPVLETVFSVAVFTVPGVVIGAQLGSLVATRISQKTMERSLGLLFILVAVLTLGEALL